MKLTIEHLAPYLPYKLKCLYGNVVYTLEPWTFNGGYSIDSQRREATMQGVIEKGLIPLLYPLSYLTKEIEHNGEGFAPMHRIPNWFSLPTWWHYGGAVPSDMNAIPYYVIQLLFEWHFDVFGLIDKGLAVDLNTLKTNPVN